MSFEREERYIVVKLKDLTYNQREALKGFLGNWCIKTRECVVVESDWPEYEPVWQMIQDRMEAAQLHREMVEYNNKLAEQADADERATDGGRNPFYEGCFEGETEAQAIHRRMVAENNKIAEQSDQAERAIRSNPALAAPYGEDSSIMQFGDPYQAMAFLLWKDVD